jgi:hypothetical protein
MKRTGAVMHVDGSSFAERDFPSAVFFHPSPPKKRTRYSAVFRRISGSGFLNLWPLKIRNQTVRLNFIYHLSRAILFQRDDDLPFASPAFQLDSSGHQARQHAAAQATEGFYFRMVVAGLILAVLLQHSFLCLVRPFGFLWPSRPKSLQMPAASNLAPPMFRALDISPRMVPAEQNRLACSEPIRRPEAP